MLTLPLAILLSSHSALAEPATDSPQELVYAMVMARDVWPGNILTEEDLFALEVPVDQALASWVYGPEDLVGKMVVQPVFANDMVRSSWFADPKDYPLYTRRLTLTLDSGKVGDKVGLWWTPPGQARCLITTAKIVQVQTGAMSVSVPADRVLAVLTASAHATFQTGLPKGVPCR